MNITELSQHTVSIDLTASDLEEAIRMYIHTNRPDLKVGKDTFAVSDIVPKMTWRPGIEDSDYDNHIALNLTASKRRR